MSASSEFRGAGHPLSIAGFASATERLQVTAALVWSVLRVETLGCGFLPDRRPQILFERHVFHELTGGTHAESHPDLSNPVAGGYGRAPQYERLARAVSLNRQAALRSTSWGLGQVMGRNYRLAGFKDEEVLVAAMKESEDEQLGAMVAFILANGLDAHLRAHNWTAFARRYNGPDFARNEYDARLAAEHQKLLTGPLPDLIVREGQVYLMYIGHDPGPIDGVMGRRTRSALGDFAELAGLGPVEVFTAEVMEKLREVALARG